MRLSIITICYNDKEGFKKTAQSIIAQTCLTGVEWVIVDGASKDGSVAAIEQTVSQISSLATGFSVYWKSESDNGIYNAMNKGICQANGEYLLFMNSGDCLYNKHVIENVLPILNGMNIYVGDIVNDYDGELKKIMFPRELTPQIILDQLIFKYIPHQAAFIKRELFDKYGLYREDLRIASDWFFFYDVLVTHGVTIQTIPHPIAIFNTNGLSSKSVNRVNERVVSLDRNLCQQRLFCFYRDNYELMTAVKATVYGRMLIRIYFFAYNFFCRLNHKKTGRFFNVHKNLKCL